MGFRVGLLLVSALLVSGGGFNSSTNETLDRTPPEQPAEILDRTPVSYRLKTYQLNKQNSPNPRGWGATEQTSDQPNREPNLLIPGPDLNPPVQQEPEVVVSFQQRVPVPAVSVAARCGEEKVTVEVKQNFLGNGQLIRPGDLTLGGCATLDAADEVLRFQTELQSCSSRLTTTDEALVYSFSLLYSPTPIGDTVILKTNPAKVVIECHYQRRHQVSGGGGARPAWTPVASDMLAKQRLHFTLRLMTEDWQSPRPSGVYFLNDVIRVEAAVLRGHHVPLRVYVDRCVATISPDPGSHPRYPFIANYGCLYDANLTGAKSLFMQRSQEEKLQFQLSTFGFQRDHSDSIYITCHLKATAVSAPVDSLHKACSFLTEANRWVASGGDNKVCSCCEASCARQRRKRGLLEDDDLQWKGTAALGPILVKTALPPKSGPLLQRQEVPPSTDPSVALLCGPATVVLLVSMGAIFLSGLCKPAYDVCA